MPPKGNTDQPAEDEEEDYMSMTFVEQPTGRGQKETYTQKKLRQQRESEAKSRVPSKAELAAADAARREAALSTSTLDPSSKGYKMMARLGFKPGSALGKPQDPENTSSTAEWNGRLTEPLGLAMKEDRGGIGMDAEKKRKFREEVDQEAKRVKTEEGDFRERVRLERGEKRAEGQFHGAQKVAERLDAEQEAEQEAKKQSEAVPIDSAAPQHSTEAGNEDNDETPQNGKPASTTPSEKPKTRTKPTSQINVLYRGLVRSREEKLRDLQNRRILHDSLSRRERFFPDHGDLPTFDDPTLDTDDKWALGRNENGEILAAEIEDEGEDEELEEFNALSPHERLFRVVTYLREKHWYCFWCKHRYETSELEGCPGLTEDDHD